MLQLSYTEENYLKCIYALCDYTVQQECSTTAIAQHLNIRKATVSSMLRKLSEKALVDFAPYGKAKLTTTGEKHALLVIRKHRLWEVFLVDKLGFAWSEVHHVAEQLEHIQSTQLIDSLDTYLNYPTSDPHGDPIPRKDGVLPQLNLRKLYSAKVNETVKVHSVSDSDAGVLAYLSQHHILPNTQLTIAAKAEALDTIIVEIDSNSISLTKKVAELILVSA
ncbi:MAG: hypothetical protein RL660_1914 [Bacteroidota bacterium]|jgi:DtxR family Mn-dependent transcriptional regulator